MFDAELTRYKLWLAKQPLSKHTKRIYLPKLEAFIAYLQAVNANPSIWLTDGEELTEQVEIYRNHLRDDLKLKASSINNSLAAISHFCTFLGRRAPMVDREQRECSIPRVLQIGEQIEFLRAIQRCNVKRDRAIALLFVNTGIRLSECVGLNISDARLAETNASIYLRKQIGRMSQRTQGTGRTIPLNAETREAIRCWLIERGKYLESDDEMALFVSNRGKRLSTASIDYIVRRLGWSAYLVVSAQVLRDTFLTKLAQSSRDPLLLSRIAGHNLEASRRYLPSHEIDCAEALEQLSSI
jgi:site-specific recombinase XerC